MQDKNRLKKLHTQYSLIWCLKIGEYLGTLSINELRQLLDVKPETIERWLSGKQAAPVIKLNIIKKRAFAPYRIGHSHSVLRSYANQATLDAELVETKYLWKMMLFDEMSTLTKRRYCKRFKKALLLG
jgi:hypothetical protein